MVRGRGRGLPLLNLEVVANGFRVDVVSLAPFECLGFGDEVEAGAPAPSTLAGSRPVGHRPTLAGYEMLAFRRSV